MSKKLGVARIVLIGLVLAVVLAPFVWIVLTSLKDFKSIMGGKMLIFEPILDNYKYLLAQEDFLKMVENSIVVSLSATFIAVAVGSLAAYEIARYTLPGNLNNFVLGWLLFIRMTFPIVLAIPLYDLMRGYKLLDTRMGLVLAHVIINVPYAVWMLRVFFASIPREIEESAKVDGCSELGAFLRITLPLAKPGLGATSIFIFIFSWNEFLFALILTSSPRAMTLPIGIARQVQQYMVQWGPMAAATTIFIIPVIIIALIAQKHLLKGLTFQMLK